MIEHSSVCAACGRPLDDGVCLFCDLDAEFRVVHREIVVLVALVALVAITFFFTRSAAKANHSLRLRDAADWYTRSERDLADGRHALAIRALRRAAALDPERRDYRLGLARALVEDGQDSSATQVLLGLRESTPEDPIVNLQLARLEARRGETNGAIRYYQSALYGSWSGGSADAGRLARIELILYLLAHDQRGRAVSELVALSANLPDDPALLNQAGRLLLDAGEPRRAIEQFRRSLRVHPADDVALAGAGEAAFQLGDYADTRTYLRAAPTSGRLADMKTIAELVVSRDPMRSGLSMVERWQRLAVGTARSQERLDACLADGGQLAANQRTELESLRGEVHAFEAAVGRQRRPRTVDVVERGVNLIFRVEQRARDICALPSALDQALLLIGQRYEANR